MLQKVKHLHSEKNLLIYLQNNIYGWNVIKAKSSYSQLPKAGTDSPHPKHLPLLDLDIWLANLPAP